MRRYINVAAIVMVCLSLVSGPNILYATGVDDTVSGMTSATLSADNSLKELSLSAGSLSPEFYYSTTKYTTTVSNDVTSVTVNAKTSNANAVIESITGYDNLAVGENTIKITVVAQNGQKAVYTIQVTRLAMGDTASGGITGEEQVATDDGAGAADEGDQQQEEIVDIGGHVLVSVGDTYMIPADAPAEVVPAYLTPVELQLTEDVVIPAYQYINGTGSVTVQETDFYLFYGLGTDGSYGWYQYDSRDKSIQRYIERFVGQLSDEDTLALQQSVMLYANQAEQLNQKIRLMTYVFIFIVAILLIIMFSVLWSKRDRDYEDDIFDDKEVKADKESRQEKKEISLIIEPTKVVKTDAVGLGSVKQKESVLEELAEDDELDDSDDEPKRVARKESFLAYLGLEDDLPLNYGEKIEEESASNRKKKKKPQKEKEESGGDDIEFIDLD